MSRFLILTIVALVGPLTACSEDPAGLSAECSVETGMVSVSVKSGSQPVFSWEPACAVAMFLIEEGASDVWGVNTDETVWQNPAQANLIAPPVTYGQVPAGSEQFGSPLPLQSGVTYEAILWRALPVGSTTPCVARFENLCLLAVHEFTQ